MEITKEFTRSLDLLGSKSVTETIRCRFGNQKQRPVEPSHKYGKPCEKEHKHQDKAKESVNAVPPVSTFGHAPPNKKKPAEADGANTVNKGELAPLGGPKFSFGSRFDSDIRAKPHLNPKKVDGPGPGDYKMPSSIQNKSKNKGHTWGHGQRDWAYLPKDKDKGAKNKKDDYMFRQAPVEKFQSQLAGNKFSKAERTGVKPIEVNRRGGDGSMSFPAIKPFGSDGYAKTMLGGSIATKELKDNGVPGPGTYSAEPWKHKDNVPGVKISEPSKS